MGKDSHLSQFKTPAEKRLENTLFNKLRWLGIVNDLYLISLSKQLFNIS